MKLSVQGRAAIVSNWMFLYRSNPVSAIRQANQRIPGFARGFAKLSAAFKNRDMAFSVAIERSISPNLALCARIGV